jgi:hypothetical protein
LVEVEECFFENFLMGDKEVGEMFFGNFFIIEDGYGFNALEKF